MQRRTPINDTEHASRDLQAATYHECQISFRYTAAQDEYEPTFPALLARSILLAFSAKACASSCMPAKSSDCFHIGNMHNGVVPYESTELQGLASKELKQPCMWDGAIPKFLQICISWATHTGLCGCAACTLWYAASACNQDNHLVLPKVYSFLAMYCLQDVQPVCCGTPKAIAQN